MKKEIINKMRNELYDTALCQQDFEKYDVKELANTNEPFFWMVRELGTTLCNIGFSKHSEWFNNEGCRMAIMRDKKLPIQHILYWNEPSSKNFYYDGWKLHRIQKEEICDIYMNVCGAAIDKMIEQHPEEANMASQPLKLEIRESAREKLKQAMEFADSLHDTSLIDCLNRLTTYSRAAVDHVIEIYEDFTKYSFGFAERVNGEYKLCGGIIYADYRTEKRWEIHT